MTPNNVTHRDLVALRELMESRLAALHIAIDKQEAITVTRFHQTNEWRAQLDRERAMFQRQDVSATSLARVQERLSKLESWMDKQHGAVYLLYAMATSGVIGLVIQVVRFLP